MTEKFINIQGSKRETFSSNGLPPNTVMLRGGFNGQPTEQRWSNGVAPAAATSQQAASVAPVSSPAPPPKK